MRRLTDPPYLAFPLRVGPEGPRTSDRSAHVREQIAQVLYTDPNERIFRPEFGAGVRRLVFEPNNSALWEITRRRLAASLTEALQGEVDPRTLEIAVEGEGEKLLIRISYALAAIGRRESHVFPGNGG